MALFNPLLFKSEKIDTPAKQNIFMAQLGDYLSGIQSNLYSASFLDHIIGAGSFSQQGLSQPIYARKTLVDDFLGEVTPDVTTTTTLLGGQLGWVSLIGAGSTGALVGTRTNGADANNRALGVWAANTGTTATGIAGWFLSPIIGAFGQLDLFFRIAISALPSGANNVTFRFGSVASGAATPTDVIALDLLHNGTNPVWRGTCRAASVTSTSGDSTTPVINAFSSAALTYYKLQISINPSWNSVSFFVNGIQIGSSVTTNIPSAVALFPIMMAIKTAGTTANAFFGDTFGLDYQYATP